MEFDHVALSVKNVYESVRMYQSKFGAVIEYEDSTWAMISMGGAFNENRSRWQIQYEDGYHRNIVYV